MVDYAFCYRRALPSIQEEERAWVRQQSIDLIVTTSQESLNNLHALFSPSAQAWLTRIPLLIISQNMAHQAKKLGFRSEIFIASNASDEAIVETLSKI